MLRIQWPSLAVIVSSAAFHASPAFATAFTPVTFAASALSYGGSIALVGGGGVGTGYGISKPSAWSVLGGVLAVAGGFAVGFADPSPGTFYAGSASFHYDPTFLSVREIGWLGDWGIDPSLAA